MSQLTATECEKCQTGRTCADHCAHCNGTNSRPCPSHDQSEELELTLERMGSLLLLDHKAITDCGHCHGTGTRYDITCTGNINTHDQRFRPCPACDATGTTRPQSEREHKAIHADEIGTGEIPAWMS